MDERKRVWCVILNQGTISAGLETQLFAWMRKFEKEYRFIFHPSHYAGRPIASNRNEITRDFLKDEEKPNYLCMVDDDNPPNRNPFELLELDKDVIGIPTPGRNNAGLFWMVYKFMDGYPKKVILEAFPYEKRVGLQQLDAISTGCVIIARRVLEKIKKPFEDSYDKDGVIIHSDDISFAHKVKQAGFTEWTHFDYNCSHYKTVDLLQMIAFANKMYNKGYKDGRDAAQNIKVNPIKMSDLIKNGDDIRQVKKT